MRAVPVPAFLRDALAVQLHGKDRDSFVFPAARGECCASTTFGAAGSMRQRLHSTLRGSYRTSCATTAASLAIASGANIKAVQNMLGHASATLTLDRYGHLFGDDLSALGDRVDVAARAALAKDSRAIRGQSVVALDARRSR